MDITLLAYGSRGDVEPFVALGQGLLKAGYRVRLVAPEVFASLVLGSGIEFVGLPGDPEQLVRSLVDTGGRCWAGSVRSVAQYVMPLATQVLEVVQAACAGSDAVIHSFLLTIAGYEIARARGIPDISAQFFPVFTSTSEFPGIAFPDLPLGDLYRRATHWVLKQTFWQGSRILYRRLRRVNSHLPRLTGWPFDVQSERPSPILYAFSPQVVPRPHDWRSGAHVTGYWFPQGTADWQPPRELTDFLDAGPPPVCVSFGSTITRKRNRLAETVLNALAISRRRGVIVGPALQVDRPPESVFWLEYAPYDWLFPRAATVVHHGGA
ncbi:MAG: glycosyltransferase, partial [Anaerolineae bacterium]|nr:glycosyltransferase [Anaerolineae bacterium]